MASNVQGRVVIGLCMDKERDEILLDFLASQKNKSDFIRNALYEKVNSIKNGGDSLSEQSSNIILKEILSVLNNISDTINHVSLNSNFEDGMLVDLLPVGNLDAQDSPEDNPLIHNPLGQEDFNFDDAIDKMLNSIKGI